MRVVGRESKYSLYSHDIATYGKESTFEQKLVNGFVELCGVQTTASNNFYLTMDKKSRIPHNGHTP